MFGERIVRREDPAFLRGRGQYVDDIHLDRMAHAAFVRSPFAHAEILSIDTGAARAAPGVLAVYTMDDLAAHLTCRRLPVELPAFGLLKTLDPPILADGDVRHVGEPVAVVIAEHPYAAEDAAQLVEVEYDPLPVAADLRNDAGDPPAHRGLDDNLVARIDMSFGDVDGAFATAAHRIHDVTFQHKGLGHAIETRGIVARHDKTDDVLTVWSATQMAHRALNVLVEVLGRDERRIRIVPPDVGGGFGPKFVFYGEEVVIPAAAMLLGRPVKWIEDRREHFTATTQERDQIWDMEAAIDADGRLLGVRGSLTHDHGAYTPYGINLPYNAATNFPGPYHIPVLSLDIKVVATNKTPVTPVRGAGRPQGTFSMERLMDAIATKLGLDRDEVRRRNMIPADAMPYETAIKTRDGGFMTYDSGDYPATQQSAMEAAGFGDFERRREAARAEGRYLGIGLANYVEGTGRGPFESALIRVGPSGKVTIATGATSQGQGLNTSLAQICAGALGVPMDDIEVVAGDTGSVPVGLGAFASRQAVNAGSSVLRASEAVRDKALKAASQMLEAAEDDLEIVDGKVRVKGVPDMGVRLADIAKALAGQPGFAIPGGMEPGLEAMANFAPPGLTYCNGTHIAEVEVDIGTGEVRIDRYVVVHDSGRLINPLIVDGQIAGGVAHGIGSALFEKMIFDDQGQPQTTNFGEYLLPTAPELPDFDMHHQETPTPLNPLGVKGAGEGGTIPATSVIASAVDDALSEFGLHVTDLPIVPQDLVRMVREARTTAKSGGEDGHVS